MAVASARLMYCRPLYIHTVANNSRLARIVCSFGLFDLR